MGKQIIIFPFPMTNFPKPLALISIKRDALHRLPSVSHSGFSLLPTPFFQMMTLEEFKKLTEQPKCPESLPTRLQAMWHLKKGNWDTAHELVQDASDADSAWIHAYMHREEGDEINALYWYKRGEQPESHLPLAQEWEQIASVLLMKEGKT